MELLLKDYIKYMHIKDSKTDGTVVPAGQGEGNIEYILSELFKEEYDGFISLEPHLGTFDGLADLELDDKMLNLPKGGEETFTLAFNELNKIRKKGIVLQEKTNEGYKFKINSQELEISDFLNYLSKKVDIKDIEIDNESLDNIIINLYKTI